MIMKKILSFFLLFISFCAYSQLRDDFSDGSFGQPNRSVVWEGDISEFFVNEFNELQLNSQGDYSPVQLRTRSFLNKNASWYCSLAMDFTPSSSNYAKIYLVSDNEDLCDELNGLFIRIGYTDKNVCLIQSQAGKKNKTLIKGRSKQLDQDPLFVEVKATLDIKGKLSLYSRLYGEKDFALEGSYQLTEFPTGEWFGVVCHFTKTRSDLFFFEEFIVEKLDENAEGTSIEENPQENKNKFIVEYPSPNKEPYSVNYQLKESGYHCKAVIYDLSGRLVDSILNNSVLEMSGSFPLQNHKKFRSGIYILYIEIFNLRGEIETYKTPILF